MSVGDQAAGDRPERWATLGAAALVAVGVDQATKMLVRDRIVPGDHVDLLPGVGLVHTTNRGVAFGLLAGNPRIVAVVTAAVLLALAVWLTRIGDEARAVMVGGGLLMGGAIGNLVDRLARGGVTDFVSIWRWPPFNVADIAIVVAAVLVVASLTRSRPDG